MKRSLAAVISICAALTPAVAFSQGLQPAHAQFGGIKMPMIARSVVEGIEGRLGHLAYDPVSGCLYIACKAAGSLEVMDKTFMKKLQSVKDLPEPRGVEISASLRRLYLTCGDGTVRVFEIAADGKLTEQPKVEFRGEANPIRLDTKTGKLYVGYGKFFNSFDGSTGVKGQEIELPGFPECIILDTISPRIFVSIPKLGQIVVIDREQNKITDTWKLKDATGNAAMALDPDSGRLFVAARSPAELLILDIKNGTEVQRVEINNDADDVWYDKAGTRVYVSCGGGKTAMIQQKDANTYTNEHMEATNAGAMTSVLIPEKRQLIVASPKVGPEGLTFLYIYVLPP